MSSTTKLAVTIPVANVRTHPRNPRRQAVADEAMVASIKESGVSTPAIVAVDLEKNTAAWVLSAETSAEIHVVMVDGHRRLAGAKKARLKEIPVVIDLGLDTEVEQVKAMLLASEHREDLSPMERAEGYSQLHLGFKVKQGDIAKAFGRTPKEISTSLKLLKLAKSTQGHVHRGQISIDDAVGLLEFDGDTAATKRLEKAAASGTDYRFRLQLERRMRDFTAATAAEVAELEAAGVRRFAGRAEAEQTGARYLHLTRLSEQADHQDGCLAYYVTPANPEYGTGEQVILMCTDPAKHEKEIAEGEQSARAIREQQQESARIEHEATQAAADAAQDVRLALLAEEIGRDLKVSPALEQLLRATLPALVASLANQYDAEDVYQRLVVPESARWQPASVMSAASRVARRDHFADVATLSKASLGKHLAAALLALGDEAFVDDWNGYPEWEADGRIIAAPYAALLAERAHEFAGPDAALLARLEPASADQQQEETASEGEGTA